MSMKQILYFILIIFLLPAGCIEDGITSSPADIPTFSVDTLDMGMVFTAQGTPTATFKIFNPHSKSLVISDISVSDDADNLFRLNVDGIAGNRFSDVEIRSRDSIFVFVEATYPDLDSSQPVDYTHHLAIVTNGSRRSIPIVACAIDATRLSGLVVDRDMTFSATKPYIVFDSLVVMPGVTLTLEPGVKLHFHDGAFMQVDGTLVAEGSVGHEIEMTGDRLGAVVGRVDYEIMAGQWDGVYFSPMSSCNHLEYTSIRNTVNGVVVDSVPYNEVTPSLYMLNCQLRNSRQYALLSRHSSVVAYGCEIADASAGVLALEGGKAHLANCTLANYYLFSALGGPALQFYHVSPNDSSDDPDAPLLSASIDNCIIYGNGTDLSHGDLADTDVYLRNCLLKSSGSDDDHFINCLWDSDPLYYTIREEYLFDYRLRPESPAVDHADPSLVPTVLTVDRYGLPFNNILGAYALPQVAE